MPIDPRLSLGVQPLQLESPVNQMAKVAALQSARNQNALAQYQLSSAQRSDEMANALNEAYRQAVNPQTGEIDANRLRASIAASGAGAKLPEIEKSLAELESAKITRDKNFGEAVGKRMELSRMGLEGVDPSSPNAADQYIAWHDATHRDPVLAKYFASRGITLEQSHDNLVKSITNPATGAIDPARLASAIQQSKLGAEKALENHFQEQGLGASVRTLAIPKYGPGAATVVPGSEGKIAVSPDTEARIKANPALQAHPLLSQATLEGRIPISRVNSRTAPIYESILQIDPSADLNAINIEQLGASAGARTAGTTKANIGIASDEANRMIGVARTIIPNVNLSDYPSLNAIQNAVSKGTGDVNIVKLNTALNSLINSYARAINPRGAATVSDKNHAREIINSAMSKGQLGGALEVMQQEMEAALGAASAAPGARGKAGEEAPAAKPGVKKTASGVSYTVED